MRKTGIRPLEKRLAAVNDIKLLTLKIKASYAATIQEADNDLGSAFNATIKAVNARPEDEFELVFRRKKKKTLAEKAVPNALLTAIRELAKRPDLKEQVSIFKIEESESAQILDILHEQFVVEKSIPSNLEDLGSVNSELMYQAIEEAYSEAKNQLTIAKTFG